MNTIQGLPLSGKTPKERKVTGTEAASMARNTASRMVPPLSRRAFRKTTSAMNTK